MRTTYIVSLVFGHCFSNAMTTLPRRTFDSRESAETFSKKEAAYLHVMWGKKLAIEAMLCGWEKENKEPSYTDRSLEGLGEFNCIYNEWVGGWEKEACQGAS